MRYRLVVQAALITISVVAGGCSGDHTHSSAPRGTGSHVVRPPDDVTLIYRDGFTGPDDAAYRQREVRLTALAVAACTWLINPESNGGSTYEIHLRVPASSAAADLRIINSADPYASAHLAALSELAMAPKLHQPARPLAISSGSQCG